MKNYRVRTGCEVAGQWRAADEVIALTADQARELAPPFGDVVVPDDGRKVEIHGQFGGRKRNNRRGAD